MPGAQFHEEAVGIHTNGLVGVKERLGERIFDAAAQPSFVGHEDLYCSFSNTAGRCAVCRASKLQDVILTGVYAGDGILAPLRSQRILQ
jgi:hypothetical protein